MKFDRMKIANALQGLGHGFAGRGTEWAQVQRQREEDERRKRVLDAEMRKENQAMTIKQQANAALAIQQDLEDRNLDSAMTNLNYAMLGGNNRIWAPMKEALESGGEDAVQSAIDTLSKINERNVRLNIVKRPEPDKWLRMDEQSGRAIMQRPDGTIYTQEMEGIEPKAAPKPASQTALGDIKSDLMNGFITTQDAGRLMADLYSKDNDFKANQYTAAMFATRMDDAAKILDELGDVNTTIGARFIGVTPGELRSEEQQLVQQAINNFITANLRDESGAAIQDAEYSRARDTYIPQPGDSPEVLAAKARTRQVLINGVRNEAGGAYNLLTESLAPKNEGEGDTPAEGQSASTAPRITLEIVQNMTPQIARQRVLEMSEEELDALPDDVYESMMTRAEEAKNGTAN